MTVLLPPRKCDLYSTCKVRFLQIHSGESFSLACCNPQPLLAGSIAHFAVLICRIMEWLGWKGPQSPFSHGLGDPSWSGCPEPFGHLQVWGTHSFSFPLLYSLTSPWIQNSASKHVDIKSDFKTLIYTNTYIFEVEFLQYRNAVPVHIKANRH